MSNFHFIEVAWVVLWYCFIICYGQDVIFRHEDESDMTTRRLVEPIQIPETLLIQMKDIRNVTDFVSRFMTINGTFNPITGDSTSNINVNGRNALAGVPRATPAFSQPAICQPEEHIVELDRPENGAIMLWPSCVRVKRCGGCCTSKMLTCNPVATSSVDVVVLQVKYNPQAPNSFEDQGSRTFTLEQHDRCACGCKEKASDCSPDVHVYRENECRCVCVNQEQSLSCTGPKKIWDSRDCMCKCRRMQQCSTGRYYNIQKCKCEVLRNSLLMNGLEYYNTTTRNSTVQFIREK